MDTNLISKIVFNLTRLKPKHFYVRDKFSQLLATYRASDDFLNDSSIDTEFAVKEAHLRTRKHHVSLMFPNDPLSRDDPKQTVQKKQATYQPKNWVVCLLLNYDRTFDTDIMKAYSLYSAFIENYPNGDTDGEITMRIERKDSSNKDNCYFCEIKVPDPKIIMNDNDNDNESGVIH